MTIQLPLPLPRAAESRDGKSLPINRLRQYLHAEGRSLIACLEFVADEAGTAAGYMLIDEVRHATVWTRAIDRRVARVRALLMLEHLGSDDAFAAPDLFDDLDGEAVHACCRHSDLLDELRQAAARDGMCRPATRPIPPRPAMRPALPPRATPAPRSADDAAVTAAEVAALPKGQRAV